MCPLDVGQMRPQLLGRILKKKIGNNEFSEWLERGIDIYETIAKKLNLSDRNQGKDQFFEIIFAPPSDQLEQLFGNAEWIRRINTFKRSVITQNPRSKIKPHSNMAWLLQKEEVRLMREVWKALTNKNILFLSVHDEVLVQEPLIHQGEAIVRKILDKEFFCYKLNIG